MDALQTVEHAAIAAATATVVTRLLAWRFVRSIIQLARHHKRVVDLLDTSKPGGLTDVENAIRDLRSDRGR